MENKEDIVKRLKILLVATSAGNHVADLILNEQDEEITVLFTNGCTRTVNIACDSGIAIIKDVIKVLE